MGLQAKLKAFFRETRLNRTQLGELRSIQKSQLPQFQDPYRGWIFPLAGLGLVLLLAFLGQVVT